MIRTYALASAITAALASAASAASAAPTAAFAQPQAPGAKAEASAPADGATQATKSSYAPPIFGWIKREAGGGSLSDDCQLETVKNLSAGVPIVAVRRLQCSTGGRFPVTREFIEVLMAGKKYVVGESAVEILEPFLPKLYARTDSQVEANMQEWVEASHKILAMEMERAKASIRKSSKAGLGILESGIFDVSDYTEGTGFRVSVFNTGKKTIKYVTFTLQGLNAVNDTVRDRLTGATFPTFKGIGPIEPGEVASYSKDYMWHTDVVDAFRIKQIKIEFMDGTSKVITDVMSLRIDEADRALLSADLD